MRLWRSSHEYMNEMQGKPGPYIGGETYGTTDPINEGNSNPILTKVVGFYSSNGTIITTNLDDLIKAITKINKQ